MGPRDDIFAGTPPLWVHRMLVSNAARQREADKSRRRLIARYDVSVAFSTERRLVASQSSHRQICLMVSTIGSC